MIKTKIILISTNEKVFKTKEAIKKMFFFSLNKLMRNESFTPVLFTLYTAY